MIHISLIDLKRRRAVIKFWNVLFKDLKRLEEEQKRQKKIDKQETEEKDKQEAEESNRQKAREIIMKVIKNDSYIITNYNKWNFFTALNMLLKIGIIEIDHPALNQLHQDLNDESEKALESFIVSLAGPLIKKHPREWEDAYCAEILFIFLQMSKTYYEETQDMKSIIGKLITLLGLGKIEKESLFAILKKNIEKVWLLSELEFDSDEFRLYCARSRDNSDEVLKLQMKRVCEEMEQFYIQKEEKRNQKPEATQEIRTQTAKSILIFSNESKPMGKKLGLEEPRSEDKERCSIS